MEIGWCGVDLFFVLSGFLITGLLLDTRGEPNFFRNFYMRRALRILPLYYAAIIIAWFVVNVVTFPGIERWPINDQLFHWVYLQNWARILTPGGGASGPLGHFWSLAVEEQFYLFWPLVVYYVPTKRLIALCACLVFFSLGLRYYLLSERVAWYTVYTLTVTRLDGLALGSLLGSYLRSGYSVRSLSRCVSPALATAALALVVISIHDNGFRFWKDRCWTLKFGPSVLAVLFSALLLSSVLQCGPKVVFITCSNRWLRQTGKYSYCMYVVHMPIAVYLVPQVNDQAGLDPHGLSAGMLGFLVTLACSVAIALLSWHYFESPFLRLKRHFETSGSMSLPDPVTGPRVQEVIDGVAQQRTPPGSS